MSQKEASWGQGSGGLQAPLGWSFPVLYTLAALESFI